jgi:hypothetical protein
MNEGRRSQALAAPADFERAWAPDLTMTGTKIPPNFKVSSKVGRILVIEGSKCRFFEGRNQASGIELTGLLDNPCWWRVGRYQVSVRFRSEGKVR